MPPSLGSGTAWLLDPYELLRLSKTFVAMYPSAWPNVLKTLTFVAAQGSGYSTNTGRHPRQKLQAPSHTTIASEPPTAIPTTGTCHTETSATVAN
jgi:hypothetical protein